MTNIDHMTERFKLHFDWTNYRRLISKKEIIIHCHHYNSRIQRTIEDAKQIDGRSIIVSSAEAVFSEMCASSFLPNDNIETKWAVAAQLYAHLGYGLLDFSELDRNKVKAPSSHFVEGWKAGFASRTTSVCSFTEGYLQGIYHAVTGKNVQVRETQCMIHGASACMFEIDFSRQAPHYDNNKIHQAPPVAAASTIKTIHSPNIDQQRIIGALAEMPIYGNKDGLIPAFGVYLANTPANFYNLVCIRFIEEMQKVRLQATARNLLMADAETCGMNTFRGIMNSAEWEGLIAPMVKEKQDNLYGVLAVSNGLGWGNWHVVAHKSDKSLELVSLNGYEALGYCEYRPPSDVARCYMLTGVAAGIMELVYGEGPFEERFGTYKSTEENCICCRKTHCNFKVIKRA